MHSSSLAQAMQMRKLQHSRYSHVGIVVRHPESLKILHFSLDKGLVLADLATTVKFSFGKVVVRRLNLSAAARNELKLRTKLEAFVKSWVRFRSLWYTLSLPLRLRARVQIPGKSDNEKVWRPAQLVARAYIEVSRACRAK